MNEISLIRTGAGYLQDFWSPAVPPNAGGLQLSINRPIAMSARFPEMAPRQIVDTPTLTALAFDARAKAKQLISQMAGHLSDVTRKKLFLTLDRMHDISEWEDGDKPLLQESFKTFVRAFIRVNPSIWPSIGLSAEGYIFATWGGATDRINIEFLPFDWAKWVLSFRDKEDRIIRNAGTAPAFDLLRFIAPYNPEHWFGEV